MEQHKNEQLYNNNKTNEHITAMVSNQLSSKVSYAILLVEDDITRHNCLWIVDNNLWVVQFATNLSINAVKSSRWASKRLTVLLKTVFLTWADVTEKHGSITMGTLGVVVALGGVWS